MHSRWNFTSTLGCDAARGVREVRGLRHCDHFICMSSLKLPHPRPACLHAVDSNGKSDPNFADKIRHTRDPKSRMAAVWVHCKTKMVCEPDDLKDEGEPEAEDPNVKKGHGGCGHVQPVIRKEGLKLFVQYKKAKDDDDVRSLSVLAYLTSDSMSAGGQVDAARQMSHHSV